MTLKGEGKGPLPPLLMQYVELREKYPDYLMLFQVGDFYECFGEDAERLVAVFAEEDHIVVGGDFNNWFSLTAYYGAERTWTRVDHRVINRMNPAVPPKFDGNVPPQGTSPDARYTSDFAYVPPPIGDPARGIYMQSVFTHSRYVSHSRGSPTGGRTAVPFLLRAESDLVAGAL
jgi:hypothetical protein